MATLTLPVGSLLKFNSLALSEHNRNPMSMSSIRIEKTQRMSNGSMRKFHIADKKRINVSWTSLPSYSTFTVDGGMGAIDLQNFYNGSAAKAANALSGRNTFEVTLKTGTDTQTFEMIFSSFSCDIIKRNIHNVAGDTPQEFWSVSLSLEEV
jgi:hypothetical protein